MAVSRRTFALASMAGAAAVVAGCAPPKFIEYDGPPVTKLQIFKSQRKLKVWSHHQLLKTFDISLGFAAKGHKQFEGDGKTPEGRYIIDRRNPNSSFYLSLGISYPNARDIAFAKAHGRLPGGEIFIHGQPNRATARKRGGDWTAGCIALKNHEMRKLYAMVKDGTIVDLFP